MKLKINKSGFKFLFFVFYLLFLSSCYHSSQVTSSHGVVSKKAMVVTAHPLATWAALKQLEKGGNAVDALVAASFMLSVVTPQSTGIGGGGFLLYYHKKSGKNKIYDFRERAPLLASEDMFVDDKGQKKPFQYKKINVENSSLNGPLSVGTPGLVAGLWKVHKEFGRLKWSQVLEPSKQVAQNGFIIDKLLAQAFQKRSQVLEKFDDGFKIFFRNGSPLKEGDRLVQKDLAKTLKLIQENGRDGFYKGFVANSIVETIQQGGILSQRDLDEYKVKEHEPVTSTYKGYRLVSMPPPSSGGIHLAQILNILEKDSLKSLGPKSPEAIHLVAEAMRRAYRDRAAFLGDPEFFKVPQKKLTSESYAQELRQSINLNKAFQVKAHEKSSFPDESDSTTHLSIVDSEGNAVSSTQTINYSFGSCVVAKGTGILLNDEMDDFSSAPGLPNAYGLLGSEANKIEPKKTMLSSMSPSFVFSEEGKLILVLGSPGGSRIITANLQTILNVIEYKMSLQKALNFPRFHHQWLPNRLFIEASDFPQQTIRALEKKGHIIKTPTRTMGNVQAVLIKKDGTLIGASDKRGVGEAKGL